MAPFSVTLMLLMASASVAVAGGAGNCVAEVEKRWHSGRGDIVDNLVTWLRESGVKFDGIDFRRSPRGGMGVFASAAFNRTDLLFLVPQNMTIGITDLFLGDRFLLAPSLRSLTGTLSPDYELSFGCAALIFEAFYVKESFWKPWFDSLPRPSSLLNHVTYFTESELALTELDFHLGELAIGKVNVVEETLQLLVERIYALNPNLVGPNTPDNRCIWKEQVRWMLTMLWSRSWANPRTPPPESGLRFAGGFIPGMDMLNHRPGGPSLVWGPHPHHGGTWYALQAKDTIAPGDEVWLTYGDDKCNHGLLSAYGFVLQDRAADCAVVEVAATQGIWKDILRNMTADAAKLAEEQLLPLLNTAQGPVPDGGRRSVRFVLRAGRAIIVEFAAMARAGCVDMDEVSSFMLQAGVAETWDAAVHSLLGRLQRGEKVSEANEACAVGMVRRALVRAKADYDRRYAHALTSGLLPRDPSEWSENVRNIMEVHEGAQRTLESTERRLRVSWEL